MAIQYFQTIEVKLTEVEDLCCHRCGTNEREIDLLCFCVECRQYFCSLCLKNHETKPSNPSNNGMTTLPHDQLNSWKDGPVSRSALSLETGSPTDNLPSSFSNSMPNLTGRLINGINKKGKPLWSKRLELMKSRKSLEGGELGRSDWNSGRGLLTLCGNGGSRPISMWDINGNNSRKNYNLALARSRSKSTNTIAEENVGSVQNAMKCTVDVHIDSNKHKITSSLSSASKDTTSHHPDPKKADVGNALTTIKQLKTQLKHMRNVKLENIARLAQEKTALFQEIQEFLDSIQQLVKDIQTDTKAKLNKLHKEFETKTKKDINKLDKLMASLIKCQQDLKTPKYATKAASYKTQIKICEKEFSMINGSFEDVLDEKSKMVKTMEDDVEELVYCANKLGNHFLESSHCLDLPVTVDLKVEDDQSICDMTGACEMADGTVVVSDYNNCRLKCLNELLQVTKTCTLISMPWAVCPISSCDVAVSLYVLKKVQFVDIKTMQQTTSFKVHDTCRGLAYSSGELFVSCGGGGLGEGTGQIRVYTTEGQPIRTIVGGVNNNPIFSCPFHIAVSQNGLNVYAADRDNGLICMDREGQVSPVIDPQRATHLTQLKGVCVDEDGSVYISSSRCSSVVRLHPQGGYHVVMAESEINRGPQSLTLIQNSNKLLVTLSNNDSVKLIHLSRELITSL